MCGVCPGTKAGSIHPRHGYQFFAFSPRSMICITHRFLLPILRFQALNCIPKTSCLPRHTAPQKNVSVGTLLTFKCYCRCVFKIKSFRWHQTSALLPHKPSYLCLAFWVWSGVVSGEANQDGAPPHLQRTTLEFSLGCLWTGGDHRCCTPHSGWHYMSLKLHHDLL